MPQAVRSPTPKEASGWGLQLSSVAEGQAAEASPARGDHGSYTLGHRAHWKFHRVENVVLVPFPRVLFPESAVCTEPMTLRQRRSEKRGFAAPMRKGTRPKSTIQCLWLLPQGCPQSSVNTG